MIKGKAEISSSMHRLPKEYEDLSSDKYEIPKYINSRTYSPDKHSLKSIKKRVKSFQEIDSEFIILKKITDNDSLHLINLNKGKSNNRYEDILPYINNSISISNKNYINASFIHIPFEKSFIATQGPLDSSIEDFWQMIYDYNTSYIIMLCNTYENGKKKCVEYWKEKTNKNNSIFSIKLLQETEYNSCLTFRKISFGLPSSKESRTIVQIQFKGWNDHSIPQLKETYDSFIEMFNVMHDHLTSTSNCKLKEEVSPIVVHCSGGVGRTGTFLSMYVLFYEISTNKLFSIWNLVRKFKEMRRCLVENSDQYQFIYQFVIAFMSNKLLTIEENVK